MKVKKDSLNDKTYKLKSVFRDQTIWRGISGCGNFQEKSIASMNNKKRIEKLPNLYRRAWGEPLLQWLKRTSTLQFIKYSSILIRLQFSPPKTMKDNNNDS